MVVPRRAVIAILAVFLWLLVLGVGQRSAEGAPGVRFGVYDDAWLLYGPGTLDDRVALLKRLGVRLVRVSLQWSAIATSRPSQPADPSDPAYAWGDADTELNAIRAGGLAPVVTLVGAPAWANGGQGPNWAPTDPASFGFFATAAASRYPWVRYWLIWNEPNQARWLRPTLPAVYVSRLLNPAYQAIHAAAPQALVGGGETAPRAGENGVPPGAWIAGMAAAGAKLDAYTHHPYPSRPSETPFSGGCSYCKDITMATIGRLISDVRNAFGPIPIWLTEYGYQTNPPNTILGVPPILQARYIGEAARRVYTTPLVTMLIQFLVKDEPADGNWQSGLLTASGTSKPSESAFPLPVDEVTRTGLATTLWGQVRPGQGQRTYRLQRNNGSGWHWVGPPALTNTNGFWKQRISVTSGSLIRAWSPQTTTFSPPFAIN